MSLLSVIYPTHRGGRRIVDCDVRDYLDKYECSRLVKCTLKVSCLPKTTFRRGACSDTTQRNDHKMMKTHYAYVKQTFKYVLRHASAFLNASSSVICRADSIFKEERKNEPPLNVYADSRCLFDRYVKKKLALDRVLSQVVAISTFMGLSRRTKGTDDQYCLTAISARAQ